MMSRTTSRVLWVIAGVLLVIAGIVCLRNPGAALTSMTMILGVAIYLSPVAAFAVTFNIVQTGKNGNNMF